MSNQQLYLAIGLPMLTIIIGFFIQNRRFDQMDARIDKLDDRIDRLDGRIDARLTVIEGDLRQFYNYRGFIQ